jgi:hypothetical protein
MPVMLSVIMLNVITPLSLTHSLDILILTAALMIT